MKSSTVSSCLIFLGFLWITDHSEGACLDYLDSKYQEGFWIALEGVSKQEWSSKNEQKIINAIGKLFKKNASSYVNKECFGNEMKPEENPQKPTTSIPPTNPILLVTLCKLKWRLSKIHMDLTRQDTDDMREENPEDCQDMQEIFDRSESEINAPIYECNPVEITSTTTHPATTQPSSTIVQETTQQSKEENNNQKQTASAISEHSILAVSLLLNVLLVLYIILPCCPRKKQQVVRATEQELLNTECS